MKKVTLLFAGAALVAASMTSCIKREEVAAPETTRSNGSATIKGYILADLDDVVDTTSVNYLQWPYRDEFAPKGTKIIATYNTADLEDGGAYDNVNETASVTTTVGDNGYFSLSVPANDDAVSVDIEIVEFEYARRVLANIDNDPEMEETTDLYIYSGSLNNINVVKGETEHVEIILGASKL